MARKKPEEEELEEELDESEYEEEYEEELEEGSLIDSLSASSWRRAAIVPLILILFAVAIGMMWKRYRDDVAVSAAYRLSTENIRYTHPPEWIERDILTEVFRLGGLDSKGILDEGVTVQVASAFELHPWVKEVERVRIAYPAKLQVELAYRAPIAMVLLPDDPNDDRGPRMLPIDANAVQLPCEDFNEEFANENFPRIDVGNTYPTGPVGTNWGDDVVAKAAKIAEVLHEDWESLKDVLHRVERSSVPTSMTDQPDFDIRGLPLADGSPGLIVHWGRAPGDELAIEPSAKMKLKRLQQWINDIKVTGVLPAQEIDLRTNRSTQEALQASRKQAITVARQPIHSDTLTR